MSQTSHGRWQSLRLPGAGEMCWHIELRQPVHLTLKRTVYSLLHPPNPNLLHRLLGILFGRVGCGHVHGRRQQGISGYFYGLSLQVGFCQQLFQYDIQHRNPAQDPSQRHPASC
jgi:hypothetical protein